MAIKWVKDNIGSFGGDPNMITIFGESAGGGSVTAQMMGQHNIGLFQRVISEVSYDQQHSTNLRHGIVRKNSNLTLNFMSLLHVSVCIKSP